MNKKAQELLIIGLGSIGRRHVANLKCLGYKNISLYRTGKGMPLSREGSGCALEYNLESALSRKPAGVIVANPTSKHIPAALAAARAGCHLFIEKPISDSFVQVQELEYQVRKHDLIVLTGFQFRFHPSLRKIKHWISQGSIGRIFSASAHWGEYLPDWHPKEDYRQGYSARRELGGGVVNTLCHPFDYLRWLIGEVQAVSAVTARSGSLDIDIEDSAEVLLRFNNGATGSVHLDYFEQPAAHWFSITGEKGKIRWDNGDGIARIYTVRNNKWKSFVPAKGFERNSLFLAEMRHFLDCLTEKDEPLCGLKDGIQALKIALAIKKSAKEKKEIKI